MKNKFRHEFKYDISEEQRILIENRLCGILQADRHAHNRQMPYEQPGYLVRSVYFDTYDNRAFYEKENGVSERVKYRIRLYNGSTERIVLEAKRKKTNMTHKDAVSLSVQQAKAYMRGDFSYPDENNTLLREFYLWASMYVAKPRVIVEYNREPFVYPEGNVRITFDRAIGALSEVDAFFDPSIHTRPIMEKGHLIMEVKFDEFLPDFIYNTIQLQHLRQTTFSKYYLCRRYGGFL